jgi:hypothetical protein
MRTVYFERNDGVGKIVLANPPKNMLDRRFSECLWQSVHEASESDIRVLLVTSEGPHFSFSAANHPTGDLALYPVHLEFPRRRGSACRARDLGVL